MCAVCETARLIAGLAGEKVTLTGTPVERGGVRALQLKTVERVQAGR
jgi:hypothetical protein